MMEHPWEGAMPPFRILGNTWFTGTSPASTHIIDSGDGLIMLDSGYQESLYLVLDSMRRCGLNPHDLRYIIHSQVAPRIVSYVRSNSQRKHRKMRGYVGFQLQQCTTGL